MFNNGSVAKTQTQIRTQSKTLTQIVAVNAICKEGLFQKLVASNDSISSATQSDLIDTTLASTLDIESIDLLALMTLCCATMHNSESKFFNASLHLFIVTHDVRRMHPALRAKWKTKACERKRASLGDCW
ncbi:hypothetical protein FOC1_g10005159 [Fusarium oxysporum f. sp. cubense race 1]|uniref:Uncharacterized protein n=1 Tax=Fusarium oxysporum f. sp. cubense (strain race 1) TaxID=1229664 RepID=N4TQ30_FUSC1|nr:hypothetical protein FOC1_g10005159 [Fusarium oxysporum f. sp. cubense race 1]